VTKSWFSQIVQGHQQPGPELTVEIWRATNGAVTRESLRPDLFGSQP
jgi:DNA-binding transcriptional regulator YdaS (Cro superfamily)